MSDEKRKAAVKKVDTIIFDLGRVLIGIGPLGEKFTRLMLAMGIPPEQAFHKFWYAPEVRNHMTGELDSREFYRLTDERFRHGFSFDEFVDAWTDIFQPIPEMEKLFGEMAKHHRIGILSDTDPLHWAHIKRIMPWLDIVERPTLSFEVGRLKPHPDMFATAAKNSGRDMDKCLFIDDLTENVDGARYCGMPALRFTGVDKLRKNLAELRLL